MLIQEYINNSNRTLYRLSKEANIPYTTLKDLYAGKTKVQNVSVDTIYKLSQALDVPVEDLIEPYVHERADFFIFKGNVCHELKNLGDRKMIANILTDGCIPRYMKRGWYPEGFYMLAMLDYLCRENGIPKCTNYNEYRCYKLEKPIYPMDIELMSIRKNTDKYKREAEEKAIPEFRKYNLMEVEVRDAV
ncbi:MAG: helix-turn-helix transcriptional regulator [Lachnospiraceae bacterium]|nr:helix-turn-helix transcriptional regulator [Lachnospiraceae bacterium]